MSCFIVFSVIKSYSNVQHCTCQYLNFFVVIVIYFLSPNLCADVFSSILFSCSVVSNSLRPHELQHARPLCPLPMLGVHPNSCPSSQWCHPAISSSVIPFSSCPPIPPSIRVFSNESTLHMRWPKYWSFSFSISPSNEHQDWSPLEWTGWISLQYLC